MITAIQTILKMTNKIKLIKLDTFKIKSLIPTNWRINNKVQK
jgi:hypothetical protein